MDTPNLLSLATSPQILLVLLYAGPDQLLPLMSVLGGILGILLIFWQRFVGFVRRTAQFVAARLRPVAKRKV